MFYRDHIVFNGKDTLIIKLTNLKKVIMKTKHNKIAITFFATLFAIFNSSSTNAQVSPPSAYSSSIQLNLVRTWDATAPETSPINLLTQPISRVRQISEYYDGFTRPLETITKQSSPLGNDIVAASTYDSWGREIYQYAPFASNVAVSGDLANDGNFKFDPFQQQAAFYLDANPNSPIKGQGETWYYGKSNYENSPQNRVLNTFAQGSSWVGSEGSGAPHYQKVQYVLNTSVDKVRAWSISINTPNSIPTSVAYDAGKLYKTINTDEQGRQVIEYTDMDGHLILRKAQLSAASDNGTGSDHVGWLCMYYVYDDYGYLRFIISPKLVQLIDGTWIINQTQADELCYRFEYDLLGRMTIQKTPGTPSGNLGEVWMVYDQRNRLVMQQDGLLRSQHQWQYLQYDNMDRPIAIGTLTDPVNYNNLSYHTNNASTRTDWPLLSSYATTELLTQNFYDDYTWMNSTNSSTLPNTLDISSASGTGNSNFTTTYNTPPFFAQEMVQTKMTRGMITGTKTEVLGSNQSQYEYRVTFFDSKGRGIQTQSINSSGGKDVATIQFDWSGKILTSLISHNKAGTNPQTHVQVTTFTYDAMGRTLTINKSGNSSITNSATGQTTNLTIPITSIESNQYNELGNLKSKVLGNTLETLQYDYNIRGWLLGMNRDYAKTLGSTSNYFGFDLGFDKTNIQPTGGGSIGSYTNSFYNGNVAGVVWKSRGDGVVRKYDYQYDNTNRMTAAGYLESKTSNVWDHNLLDFSVNSISYDANGNISTNSKNGFLLGGSQNIDNLGYTYLNNGVSNRLQNVVDNSTYNSSNPQSFLGDFHYAGTKTINSVDYTYDANGNITSDANRQIQSVTYNYLNLPSLITIANNKGTIQFIYDAGGRKVKKVTTENSAVVNYNGINYTTSITTTTSYIGNFVYQSKAYSNGALSSLQYTDQLLFSGHEQGRIRFIPAVGTAQASFVFDYFIRDHQGNTRVVLTDEIQTDTYPATTLETTTFNGGTAQSVESQFYNISSGNCVNTSVLGWWTSATGNSYQNQNNNGNPANPNPYSNVTANSSQVYQLCGNTFSGSQTGDRFGLGITLKVMSGDLISVFGKSVYHLNAGQTIPTGSYPVSAVLASFLSAFANTGPVTNVGHGSVTGTSLNNSSATTGALTSILDGTPNPIDPTHTPKAGINWILFDDQFRPVANGFEPVNSASDIVKTHNSLIDIPMPVNGYLYVFCSNESNINVYFDNLQVVHKRGRMVEENHYYPEGLSMYAISDRAWNKQVNFYHFEGKEIQGQEFYDGTGLDEYDFGARFYDQQLGRWIMQDPASQFASPYLALGNNWPNATDPNGKFVPLLAAVIIGAVVSTTTYVAMNFVEGGSWNDLTLRGFAISAGIGALSGALGYGASQLGVSLFGDSFGQSFGYNFMSNMAVNTGINAIEGNHITWGSMAALAVSGLMDGALPNFKGFGSGKTYSIFDGILNGVGEIGYNVAKGAYSGGMAGMIQASIDGTDISEGFVNGARSGMIGAGFRTGANLVILGPTIRPNDAIKKALYKMGRDLHYDFVDDPYGPVYRTGGIWGRGLSVGNTHEISGKYRNLNDEYTWIHETYHYYQFLTQGWETELGKGFIEQFFMKDAYHTRGTNEWNADYYWFNGRY